LLEAAVRATVLQFRGIDSMQEFLSRQEVAMKAEMAEAAEESAAAKSSG
jgi:hypothetical protein